ncbi:hypothetical protein SAMN05421830_10165 [Desulfomicrobium norvegicum]|uniref:Tle cognate immunity protein 4 C-terminal domain-containing protein n=1 Tax=Desulfomicrobium norvegicum (strain DSM 1741 / NCIMB 8310) TaxID=52561 RepID=A0A8G2F6D1_DESNO|nr:hypothetical protein [Desulfomicrobium norvegicum]SFL23322.1 hypothetical protein SAMN05421830_10165 [Desulfomicrobium norvegicum]
MVTDTVAPDAKLPSCPVILRPVGRFVLPVHESMELSATWFKVNGIAVEEIPWKPGLNKRNLDALKESLGTKAGMANEIKGLSVRERWDETDVSDLFGFPSMLRCCNGSRADHNLEVYIGMPEVILCLTENRPFDTCGPCLTVNGPILNLFRKYHHGNEIVSPTGFFFSAGRVEGLKTWSEQAGMSLERPPSESLHRIRLRFDAHLFAHPCDPPRITEAVKPVTSKYRIELKILRSRENVLAGLKGLEEIYILQPKDKDCPDVPRLTACWEYEGAGGDPQKPHIQIKMSCRIEAREDALRMWDAIICNFSSVREFFGGSLKNA